MDTFKGRKSGLMMCGLDVVQKLLEESVTKDNINVRSKQLYEVLVKSCAKYKRKHHPCGNEGSSEGSSKQSQSHSNRPSRTRQGFRSTFYDDGETCICAIASVSVKRLLLAEFVISTYLTHRTTNQGYLNSNTQ